MPEVETILPPWLALLGGSLALISLASHLLALNGTTAIDPSRRRIRTANTVLMMLAVPFIAYGFGIATPSHARGFVYVWVVTAALLMMVTLVALIDMTHSWTLHRKQLRDLRRQLAISRDLEARTAAILADARGRPGTDEKPGHDPRR